MNFPPLLTALIAALVVSLAGNGMLARGYLKQRDLAHAASEQAERNLDVAKQCSAGVESIQKASEDQVKQAELDVAAARAQADQARRRAIVSATRPATRPGDDCGSAQDRIDQWMRER